MPFVCLVLKKPYTTKLSRSVIPQSIPGRSIPGRHDYLCKKLESKFPIFICFLDGFILFLSQIVVWWRQKTAELKIEVLYSFEIFQRIHSSECTDLDNSSWTFYAGAYFTILCFIETYHNSTGYSTITLVFIFLISQTFAVSSCISAHFYEVVYAL